MPLVILVKDGVPGCWAKECSNEQARELVERASNGTLAANQGGHQQEPLGLPVYNWGMERTDPVKGIPAPAEPPRPQYLAGSAPSPSAPSGQQPLGLPEYHW